MCLPSSEFDEDHDEVADNYQWASSCSSCDSGTTGISGNTGCFAPKQQEALEWEYSSDTVVGYGHPASSIMYGPGPGLVGHLNNDLTVSVNFGQPKRICGVYTDTTKAFKVLYQDATGNFIQATTFPDASGADATLNFAPFESQFGKLMWVGAGSTSGTGFHAEFMLCPGPATCDAYTCSDTDMYGALKSNAKELTGSDDATCCDDWDTTFAGCPAWKDVKQKCPNGPVKCFEELSSNERISVCGEYKKQGASCTIDPLALQFLTKNIPCDDIDEDDMNSSTTISASILAFVGSYVILLA